MRTINKLTKLVLSFLLVITCINFSIVQAEDGSDKNYSEPTAVETISEEPASEPEQEVIPEEPPATEEIIVEEPVAEEPMVEEAAPVEEEKQEEAAPEVKEEAKVEEENNTPEIEAEPATQEEAVEPEVQQEAQVAPEVQKVETVEEVKVTVVVSYVDESDHPLTDPITGSYPIEYRLDENVDAFKSFDGYAFEKVIVNDDAKNTISKDDVQKNGFRITKDMTSLKLVYQKMNLESNESKEVIPEVTEEASEEAEPESNTNETELSAFDQTAFAGKVDVHASAAEGVLPKGARLIVEQVNRKAILNAVENTVSDNNKEMDSAVALDISIVDKDGNKIQPNGIVNITFVNTGVSGDEVKIYHVEDDASAVTEIANNTDSFDASHFSIYVIAGENSVPLATYKFIANDSVVSTQIVKDKETLIKPTAPDIAGKAFVGWYLGDTEFEDFNTSLSVKETKEIIINAKYEDALYVYFYNPDGTKIMRTEKVPDHDARDFTNVSYEVNATHKIVGWAAQKNGTTNIADSIAVPTDKTSVNVYAIIKEGYWISFDSDGGSIVDSQFVLNGDKLTLNESTTPAKPGYTFDGWYDESSKVENGATVTNPMTLKAYWNAAEVRYTVIHWWENADDDGYSFHESEELHGLTGESTAALAKSYTTSGKNIRGESVKDKVFTASTISQKTIKGDGSTIVNVYYKRKTYTMHFKKKKSSGEDLSTITKKWGQSISKDEWPTYDENGNWQIREESYWNSARYIAFTSTMPMNDSILWTTSGSRTYTAYYYVQKITGNGYDLHHTDVIKGSGRLTIGHEDCYAISGFTFEYCNPDVGGSYNGAKFYYTRNSYYLKFINNGKQDKTVTKKYEQSISGENYTPTRPSSLPEYYVFDGWYENELCEGEAYNFTGQKMPAQNVTLYAKWTASDVKLTYNLNNPEGDVVKGTKKVEAGTIANTVLPSATTTSDYSFAGWYYADGNGNITSDAYNTNEAITKDTSVIGKWLYNGELKVVYDPGTEGTNATVPTDTKVYAGGANVTVGANATTTSNKKFLGWQLNGNLYQPGASFEINKDLATEDVVTLTAIWGSEEASTTLTYDPGNGRGTAKKVAVLNNVAVTIESHGTLGFLAPEVAGKEYYFAGWATSLADATAGNATYSDSQTIRVDVNKENENENVLYATWVEKTVITLVANSSVGNKYDGTKKEVSGFQPLTNSEYTVEGLTAHAEGTDAGVYETEITGTPIVKLGDNVVTDRVVVKTQKGNLTISKRDVTLTSASDEKVYDRTPLTNHSVTPSGDGFVNGEGATYNVTGSQTVVGSSNNEFTYRLKSNTKASNYSIEVKFGELKVTAEDGEVVVTITGHKDTFEYDGNEKSVKGYEVSITQGSTYTTDDFTFNGSDEVKETTAGTYPMGLQAEDFSNNNANYSTVTFVVNDGSLIINPKSIVPSDTNGIEVSNPSDSEYDGKPHVNPITVRDAKTNADLVENTDFTLTYSGDTTNVGTVTIIVKGIGNYTGKFTKTYRITPRPYTVTTESDEKVYDGTPLTVGGSIDGIVEGDVVEVHTTGSQTDVGESKNTYELVWKGARKENYQFKDETIGTLKVTEQSIDPGKDPDNPNPSYVGVKVDAPENQLYDGKDHQWIPEVLDKENQPLTAGKDYTVTYTDDSGEAKDDFTNVTGTIHVTISGKGNYTGSVTREYEITKRSVKLTSETDEKEFDGMPLTRPVVTIEGDGFVDGEVSDVKAIGTVTSVEESPVANKITYVTHEAFKYDNYNIELNEGTLTITPKSIIPDGPHTPDDKKTGITVENPKDVKYDGKDHAEKPIVKDGKTGITLEEGKDYEVVYPTDIKNVGTVTATVNGKGNYDGSFEIKYNILKRDVVLTSATDSKKYDGTALTNGNVEITGDGFAEGEGATFNVTGTITNTGSTENTFTYELNEGTLASNYNIETNAGTLTITPKSIIPDGPHTPDDKKTGITVENPKDVKYDGKEHAQKPIVKDEKTGVTLEEGTDYEIVYPTDIKNAGTVTATVKGIGDYNGSFEIKYNILKRDVTFTSATDSKQYDGNAFTNGSVEITGDGFVEGEGVTFNVTGSITDAGSTKNTFTYVMHTGTNAGNYNVTVVEGTLTVTAASVVPRQPETPQNPPARPSRPNVPARIVTHPATTTPAPEATVEPEKAETTPAPTAKPEKIKEEATPQAAPKGHWALINLIAAMLSVVLAVAALLAKHAKEEDEEEKDDQVVESENQDDETVASKRHRTWKIVAVIDAIAAVVVFILTENLAHDMVLVDKWTVLMVLFGLISIVSTYFARKWHEEDEDEDEQSSQNA